MRLLLLLFNLEAEKKHFFKNPLVWTTPWPLSFSLCLLSPAFLQHCGPFPCLSLLLHFYHSFTPYLPVPACHYPFPQGDLLTVHHFYVPLMAYLSFSLLLPASAVCPHCPSFSPLPSLLISLHLCSSFHPSPVWVLAFRPLIELASLEYAIKQEQQRILPLFSLPCCQREWAVPLCLFGRDTGSEKGIFWTSLWSFMMRTAFLLSSLLLLFIICLCPFHSCSSLSVPSALFVGKLELITTKHSAKTLNVNSRHI